MTDTEKTECYIVDLCTAAKTASPILAQASSDLKNRALAAIADLLTADDTVKAISEANQQDLDRAAENGVPSTMLDRLTLNQNRVAAIAASLRDLIGLHDPIGDGDCRVRPNGLRISRRRVPLGVVAIIYEARPNVTVDAAALCLKTGNACVLRGGKEALFTNRVLIGVIRQALKSVGLPEDGACLVDDITREATRILMRQRGLIDCLIPRGGAGLIRAVVDNALVPVIETGSGNCHTYIDESADLSMALSIAVNAKTSRPSVCNAMETLLVHRSIAEAFLPPFAEAVKSFSMEIRGCPETVKILKGAGFDESTQVSVNSASEADYATEFNDYILAIRVVDSLDEAISHIRRYSTGHSEAIVTSSMTAADRFQAEVDAAAVYVNASTRFTDGGEFGFGAEVGISTQKLHARGPMGLTELTTVKYLVNGNGQIR